MYDSRTDRTPPPNPFSKEAKWARRRTVRGDRRQARALIHVENFDLVAGLRSTRTCGWDTH